MSDTQRVAKNTLMLYFRQILIMAVSLYTSRVVLATLGISDYGIYNVIGGFVAMFSIISGSMSIAISRFITIEVGRKNGENIKNIFSTSILIQIIISLIVIVLCEILGIWFIYNKMNVEPERVNASFWVMQCSLLTFVVNLLSIPYNAIIIAHEKMSAFAYISILEVILKLAIVYLLYILPFDKLIVYSFLLFSISILIRLVYGIYCKKHFENECKFSFVFNKSLLKEMYSFIGWAFFGNGVIIVKDYGTNILLNIFCGTIMNAARGVAGQVNAAIVSFVQNFMMALNPQITKTYAEKDYNTMHRLIIRGQKFSYFILLILFMLFAPNINYILSIWLKEVPPHTANLIILILLYSLTETYSNPLVTGVLAEGNIKNYEIVITFIYAINFIVSYIILKMEGAVETVFAINIVFKIFVCIELLIHSKKKYNFPIKFFITKCVVPTIIVSMICICLTHFAHTYNATSFVNFVLQSLINSVVCFVVIYFIGLNKNERSFILSFIKSKFSFNKGVKK